MLATSAAALGPVPVLARGGFAGQWAAHVLASCDYSQPGASLCAYVMPPTWTGFVDNEHYRSDATGNFAFEDVLWIAGNTAGATRPLCSTDVFAQPFTGLCLITARGTGSIVPGYTGLPDFVIGPATFVFHSHPSVPVSNPFGPSVDTGYPAVAGIYDARAYLTLLGAIAPGETPPPGLSLLMIITHQGG
jgi:hypothetical protein